MSRPSENRSNHHRQQAFTLVELLVVISIIGILSAIIITYVTNAAKESRLIVARQQQVVLQEALNAWIASGDSLGDARDAYSTNGGTMLPLLAPYLKNTLDTQSNAMFYADDTRISSEVLDKIGKRLSFTSWGETNYPVVELR